MDLKKRGVGMDSVTQNLNASFNDQESLERHHTQQALSFLDRNNSGDDTHRSGSLLGVSTKLEAIF